LLEIEPPPPRSGQNAAAEESIDSGLWGPWGRVQEWLYEQGAWRRAVLEAVQARREDAFP